MTEYREVLFTWASEWLDTNAIVTDVKFVHDDGYYYSDMTFQNPYNEIRIQYTVNGDTRTRTLEPEDMPFGELITRLFDIASKESND